MKGILVFNQLNDLVYLNCCRGFAKHVRKLASQQGLSSFSGEPSANTHVSHFKLSGFIVSTFCL